MSETKPGHAPELKENKETEPKITVNFFFSAHSSQQDFDRLPEALKNADVFIPENIGWKKKEEREINTASRGEKSPSKLSYIEPIVYNLKIPVIFIDLPDKHALLQEFAIGLALERRMTIEFFSGNFDESLRYEKEAANAMSSVQKQRETFIANELKKKLKNLTQEFPQLKNKKDINVLVSLGAIHTSVHQQLKSELQLPKKIISRDTITFPSYAEIIRRLIKNPQEKISDETYARALLEESLARILLTRIERDHIKILSASRKLAANVSVDQIRSFCTKLAVPPTKENDTPAYTISYIKTELQKIGIKLPENEEEIDKLLNIKHRLKQI